MEILGIDIGGSGIKGAPVDIKRGILAADRHRIPTPQPSKPEAVAEVVAEIAKYFEWQGPIGCTFPAVIKDGVVYTAANVDKSWIGANGQKILQKTTGCPVLLLNDADAAGIAEMKFGAGKGHTGVVVVVTLGTGIGTAIFVNGHLIPNTEFGHIEVRGKDAEDRASDRIRKEKNLNWRKYADRVDEFLGRLEALFSPDLFIIGGGVSKKHEKFIPLLHTQAEVVPAQMLNEAGIIGAARAARSLVK
ncbi:MAG: ROK family protein [Anaerolineae bacterium]|nr:ROK family protein [Anaerolineae bacterium]